METQEIKQNIFAQLKVTSESEVMAWMQFHGLDYDLKDRTGWIRLASVIDHAIAYREPAYPIERIIKGCYDTDINNLPTQTVLNDWHIGKSLRDTYYANQ